ncbi:oxygen-independent coproporphyrinogen III oxidase [Alcaligenes endophyticus]|uniref:Coproporphyrinogen-III oxidase n=1 Tax=Alcaligenes endophyticus TaxID=1929088 RepID=A0ABT8EL48_9BURK|nr:oxygen-independent coproporphyrinogen III oxidase [Alcaligenes endophyticus]MCX5590619.1 oxygen-independent coproporphyrinogen III oxidase [Alcaligenes endophyticus]MDN4122017.1 oxygen-independent coproporphyrinogen III oxidase [Alcaligenes endophyticus]
MHTTLEAYQAPEPLNTDLVISEELIRRFDRSGPRYTSYPTADRFFQDFPAQPYVHQLSHRASSNNNPPLSVYLHIPFCQSLCYFCACNKVITQDRSKSTQYLRYLKREIEMASQYLGSDRLTEQLHLGGGSPTFLNHTELAELMAFLRQHFHFTPGAELGIEIDPRTLSDHTFSDLASLGFNRTSFGVQDFNPDVQQAVNRMQPLSLVQAAMSQARAAGFSSINTDLIYGLPKQSSESFAATVEALIQLRPDRIALYNYAHLPHRFKAQRLINAEHLPDAEQRLALFTQSTQRLLDAGYVYIGLDHFALPEDELNLARLDKSLHRNFQGYTTRAECDLLAFGVSAIGKVGAMHVQNLRSLRDYYADLDRGRLPIDRGIVMQSDDVLRADLIMRLMCSMPVDFNTFEQKYAIRFEAYFERELQELASYVDEGLVTVQQRCLQVTPKGRLFVRAISMVFDAYLAKATAAQYSRLI